MIPELDIQQDLLLEDGPKILDVATNISDWVRISCGWDRAGSERPSASDIKGVNVETLKT